MKRIAYLLLFAFAISFLGMLPATAGTFSLNLVGDATILQGETASFNVQLGNNTDGVNQVKMTISYDTSKMDVSTVRGVNGWTATNKSARNGVEITATTTSSSTPDISTIFNITFKVKDTASLGASLISITKISGNGPNGNFSGIGNTISASLIKSISANNYLKSLNVSGEELIPKFDKGINEYTVSVKSDKEQVSIGAEVVDRSAKVIDGTGTYRLDYGNNVIIIAVQAGSGGVRQYKLVINRTDPRSGNNNLRLLEVDSGSLSPKFNGNILEYKVDVSGSTESITVKGAPVDSKARIVGGTGTFNLQPGNNNIHVNVQSERGIIKTYLLKVNRDDGRSSNDFLSTLDGGKWVLSPSFDKNISNYTMVVPNDVTSVALDARSEHSEAVVSVTGNETLNIGNNAVTVVVTAQNGGQKLYNINVIRAKSGASSDVSMSSIYIKGINKNIKLKDKIVDYQIETFKNTEHLVVEAIASQNTTSVKTEVRQDPSNPNLKIITVVPIAEDGTNLTYTIMVMHKDVPIWMWILLVLLVVGVVYFIYKIIKNKIEENKKKKQPVYEEVYYNDDPTLFIPNNNNDPNNNHY